MSASLESSYVYGPGFRFPLPSGWTTMDGPTLGERTRLAAGTPVAAGAWGPQVENYTTNMSVKLGPLDDRIPFVEMASTVRNSRVHHGAQPWGDSAVVALDGEPAAFQRYLYTVNQTQLQLVDVVAGSRGLFFDCEFWSLGAAWERMEPTMKLILDGWNWLK